MLELKLSVKRSVFRSDDPETDHMNAEFKKMRPEVLKRDKNTCAFCGFRAEKYQEVHHVDDDHSNNSLSNLITTCSLCHANQHMGFSGKMNRGTLIYLNPDWGMTQVAINNIARQLWVSEGSDNPEVALLCSNVTARLERCALDAKKLLATNELSLLADYYLRLDDEKYNQRGTILAGVFMMPRKEGFSENVEYWKTLKSLSLKSVEKTAEQRLRQWADSDGTILELCKKLNIEIY
jgi:intracellular multiplication protein IcmJ